MYEMNGRTKGGAARNKGRRGKVKGAASEFFDSKAGIFTATVLSLFLWWVPYLGPMAAGFMGGRKAGSMFRGILVGALSFALVLAVTTAISVGVASLMTDYQEAVEGFSPALYEKLGDLSSYLEGFVTVTGTSISFDQSNYFLMVALCIIGGAFADQSRREVKAIVDLVKENNQAPVPRSMKAFKEHRTFGFRTYEDYARMSVNVASASEAKAAERKPQKAPAPEEPRAAETAYRPQQAQTTSAGATPTMGSGMSSAEVPETPTSTTRTTTANDDYEFL